MSTLLEEIRVRFGADISEFNENVEKVLKSWKKGGEEMIEVGKHLSLEVTAELVAIAAESLNLASKEEAVDARLKSSLNNVGVDYSKVTGLVHENLEALQRLSGVGHVQLESSYIRLIQITGNAQLSLMAMKTATELSRATGMSLEESVNLLGKAYGGTLRPLQMHILGLHAGEKGMQALDDVTKKFSGNNAEYMRTLAGVSSNLKNRLEDASEHLGRVLMPLAIRLADAVGVLVGWLEKAVNWFDRLSPAGKATVVMIASLAAALGPTLVAVGTLVKWGPGLWEFFTTTGATIASCLIEIVMFAALALFVYSNWSKVIAMLKAIFFGLADAILYLVTVPMRLWLDVMSKIPGIGSYAKAGLDLINGAIETLGNKFTDAADDMQKGGDWMGNTVNTVKSMMNSLGTTMGFVAGKFKGGTGEIKGSLLDLQGNATAFAGWWARWAQNLEENQKQMTDAITSNFSSMASETASFLAKGAGDWSAIFGSFLMRTLQAIASWAITNSLIVQSLSAAMAAALTNPYVALAVIGGLIGAIVALSHSFPGVAMAEGGITQGPTRAFIGDNPSGEEAVIPLDSPSALSKLGGGGGPKSQTILVQLDSKTIVQAVVQGMPGFLKLHGIR